MVPTCLKYWLLLAAQCYLYSLGHSKKGASQAGIHVWEWLLFSSFSESEISFKNDSLSDCVSLLFETYALDSFDYLKQKIKDPIEVRFEEGQKIIIESMIAVSTDTQTMRSM